MNDKVLIEEGEIDLTNMFDGMEIGDILQRGKKRYEVEFFGNTEVTVSTETGDIKNIYFEDLSKYKNLSKMERDKA